MDCLCHSMPSKHLQLLHWCAVLRLFPLQPVQAPYGLQAQGFGQTAYGAAGYRGGGGIGAVGLGGMPAAMGNAQLGMGAGLSGGPQASLRSNMMLQASGCGMASACTSSSA